MIADRAYPGLEGGALMGRNAISALAILLCTLVIGAMVLHERCRLGNQNWQLCGWMGIPHSGAPFPQPLNEGERGLGGHLSTRVCDLLDCKYPVVLAGMGGVARSELVAAITNAGGFGFLGMVREPPSLIRKEVEAVRRATSQQFGVNLIPAATDSELLERQLHMCIDFGFGSRHELICERNPWHSYLLGTTARVRALRPAIQCCGMR